MVASVGGVENFVECISAAHDDSPEDISVAFEYVRKCFSVSKGYNIVISSIKEMD